MRTLRMLRNPMVLAITGSICVASMSSAALACDRKTAAINIQRVFTDGGAYGKYQSALQGGAGQELAVEYALALDLVDRI